MTLHAKTMTHSMTLVFCHTLDDKKNKACAVYFLLQLGESLPVFAWGKYRGSPFILVTAPIDRAIYNYQISSGYDWQCNMRWVSSIMVDCLGRRLDFSIFSKFMPRVRVTIKTREIATGNLHP